jgi:ubiquinone/menaquinone biosynthesis C-methylase UbiE
VPRHGTFETEVGHKMADYKQYNFETYEHIAEDYSRANFKPFWVNEFKTYRNLISGKKVIDIGCGAGRDAVVFTDAEFDYTGIDVSPAMLQIAKKRAPKGTYHVMDFFHLDFLDDTFDGFWAAASFLHVPKADVSQLIHEAKRVVKSGGIGFLSVKEKDGMEEGMIEQTRFGQTISRYFAFYEKDEFKNYLIGCGLEVVGDTTYREKDDRGTTWLGFFVKKP